MKLAVNTTSLLSPLTGIGQYTYQLCKQILAHPEISPYFFYGFQWSKQLRGCPVQGIDTSKRIIKKFLPNAYQVRNWVQARSFARMPVSNGFDVYHEPNYLPLSYEQKLVVTVHDVSFIRYPEAHPADRIRDMERFPEAIEKADAIITDSYFTARELSDCFSVNSAKVVPIHLGVTSQYYPRNENQVISCLQGYDLTYQSYVLVVGTLEPRKNLRLVLDAYRSMPVKLQERYPLVVIGMKGWGSDDQLDKDMAFLINSGRLRLLGYVPLDEMPLLYAAAKLFVYPSKYEGFGLPPLEAMASGTPVITSNRASLPEVVGDAGIQVDAENTEMLLHAMLEVLGDDEKSRMMIQQGLMQSAKFSWERCAASTIEVYKQVAG